MKANIAISENNKLIVTQNSSKTSHDVFKECQFRGLVSDCGNFAWKKRGIPAIKTKRVFKDLIFSTSFVSAHWIVLILANYISEAELWEFAVIEV